MRQEGKTRPLESTGTRSGFKCLEPWRSHAGRYDVHACGRRTRSEIVMGHTTRLCTHDTLNTRRETPHSRAHTLLITYSLCYVGCLGPTSGVVEAVSRHSCCMAFRPFIEWCSAFAPPQLALVLNSYACFDLKYDLPWLSGRGSLHAGG